MRKCSKAPGKVLLFGEHFVVRGRPAIGLAVSLYARVCVEEGSGRVYSRQLGSVEQESRHKSLFNALLDAMSRLYAKPPRLDIYVDSEIPIASGMGSSAAVAVALAHAVLSYMGLEFTREDVRRLAHEAEKAVHHRPSGVDTTLATYGGLLYYVSGEFRKLDLKLPGDVVIAVVNTRVERQTGMVVKEVLERYERLGEVGELIYNAAGKLVERALELLEKSNSQGLGELMLVNHGLLWAIGASSEHCDRAVYELLRNGAYGAKLSGAGRGGIVIGLVPRELAEKAKSSISSAGYEVYIVEPDYTGVSAI